MITIYRLNADELDDNFIESLRAIFKHKQIEIAVSEFDETEYLKRSAVNQKCLLDAIDDVEKKRNIVIPDQTVFQ